MIFFLFFWRENILDELIVKNNNESLIVIFPY